jgi:two-component system C4-dicarboxylate transport sensor histidine kinase DctB
MAVDLTACLERALSLLEAPLRQGAVEVARNLPPGYMVLGDALRLEQVFVNLIRNALDSMAATERRWLGLDVVRDGDTVVVRVADNGGGIPPEVLSRVFEPFFTTKEVGEGLGLGLSLSYAIIADMGGAIHAANRPEGGAVFSVTLAAA